MPQLRSWLTQHPDDWSEDQQREYAQDYCLALTRSVAPAVPLLGPMTVVNMLWAIAGSIVRENPDSVDPSIDLALDWAQQISKIEHVKRGAVN